MLPSFEAYVGHAAGLATSMLWTATSLFFTAAARRLGPVVVNTARILLAIVMLGLTHRFLSGQWIPDMVAGQLWYLALSGLVGLSLGDQALLTAFVDIGPRLAMLIMTTAPLFAAFFGWAVLEETLPAEACLGMGLTIGGVAWVVLERPEARVGSHSPHRMRGVILALAASACQAGGLLLSKQGMGHGWLPEEQHLDPQAATLARMVFAAVGMLPILALYAPRARKRRAGGIFPTRVGTRSGGFLFVFGGAVAGPFLGVWMSLVASDRAPLGIAQTLCSLTPVFILPFSVLIHTERVSPRAILGAVIAVAGIALLFAGPT